MSAHINDGEKPSTSQQRHNKQESRDIINTKGRPKSPETPHEHKPTKATRRRSASSSSVGTKHHIDFTAPFAGSDVVFKVQGKRVHAVSAVLKVASKEFEELIEQQGSVVDLRTGAIEYGDLCELMEMLHPIAGKTKHINSDNVYRLLPLIRLFDMSALQDDCEEYLIKLAPELRHLAFASEYQFENLEDRVIDWAATKTLQELEKDQDWGLVTTRQRRYILVKLVRKYELERERTQNLQPAETENVGYSGQKETTKSHSDEGIVQAILEENEKLRRELEHLKKSDKHLEHLREELEKSKSHGDEIYRHYEKYKRTIKDIRDVLHGRVRAKSLQLHCKSKAMDQHYSGSEDKCSTCRSYMVTQIKHVLDDN